MSGAQPPADADPAQRYLASVADPARRAALAHVREVVLAELPDAEPVTSYQLPAFRDPASGRVVCGFAATARGCSLYPFSGSVVAALGERLAGFGTTKGSIHFTPAYPLPDSVITQAVRLRLAEIASRGR